MEQYSPIFKEICTPVVSPVLTNYLPLFQKQEILISLIQSQKCALTRETLKMKIVLALELLNFLLETARIIYGNIYDRGGNLLLEFHGCRK